MALVRNFEASTFNPNEISLVWNQPLDFNDSSDEIIITRTITHFPMELFNSSFPNKATDSRGVEVFRGKTIVGLNEGTISVSGDTITDTSASLPTNPSLKGRLLRDASSKVYRILSNTSTSITLDSAPSNGKYVVLPDFPQETRAQENFELDVRTEAGSSFIRNLVKVEDGSLVVAAFSEGELANLIFRDGDDNIFIVKNNTQDTITFFGSATPVIGQGMRLFDSFSDSIPKVYIDNFKTESEADSRDGSSLLDDQFYYYTVFTKPENTNVAQAEFGNVSSRTPTQDFAISTKDNNFGQLLYDLWPVVARELDTTEDLEDLMKVFGFQLNEIHSLIATYNLQDTHNVLSTALLPLSEQTGLPSIGFSLGADTLRRIASDMIECWKLKGSKEGLFVFIRKLTTWDITNGTGDVSSAIQDFLPNVEALRFFDPNLGSTNTRLTNTDPFVAGGRFAKSLPGVVIPGFFTFREFVVEIPDVALFVGESEGFTVGSGTTTMIDTSNNFGSNDSLVGNFLLPNEAEVNDIFEIVGNTQTSITVRGIINNRNPGGSYAVLSPLNTNRFTILNKLMPTYQPFGTQSGFNFT